MGFLLVFSAVYKLAGTVVLLSFFLPHIASNSSQVLGKLMVNVPPKIKTTEIERGTAFLRFSKSTFSTNQ